MSHIVLKSSYLNELEQENFKPELLVEKLALKILGENVINAFSANEENNIWKPDLLREPELVKDAFIEVLEELQVLKKETEKKIESLNLECLEEEQTFINLSGISEKKYQNIIQRYQELDDKVNFVANKVIHLGDQLETVNAPRLRLIEARKLLKFYSEFLTENMTTATNVNLNNNAQISTIKADDKNPFSEELVQDGSSAMRSLSIPTSSLLAEDKESIFKDRNQLMEAADIIQKLYVISQEVISEPPKVSSVNKKQVDSLKELAYAKTRERISHLYDKIEGDLIEEFIQIQADNAVVLEDESLALLNSANNFMPFNNVQDLGGEGNPFGTSFNDTLPVTNKTNPVIIRLRELVGALSNFKNYYRCVDAFMEQCQVGAFYRQDIFGDALLLCKKTCKLIENIFPNPPRVYSKFIINVFQGKLNDHIQQILEEKCANNIEQYLKNVYELYMKAKNLSDNLVDVKMGIDDQFLSRLVKNLFGRYIENYISIEMKFLRYRCQVILDKFYASLHHEKRPIITGGLTDFKRMIGVGQSEPLYIYEDELSSTNNPDDLLNPFNANDSTNKSQPKKKSPHKVPLLLISDDTVCKPIIEEIKEGLNRSKKLSNIKMVSSNAFLIFDILLEYLYGQHIDYAIDLELQNLVSIDTNLNKYYPEFPEITFLRTLRVVTRIFLRIEELYDEQLVPLLSQSEKNFIGSGGGGVTISSSNSPNTSSSQVQSRTKKLRKTCRENSEAKLAAGLERYSQMLMSRVRYELTLKQKKSDFNPPLISGTQNQPSFEGNALNQLSVPSGLVSSLSLGLSTSNLLHNSANSSNLSPSPAYRKKSEAYYTSGGLGNAAALNMTKSLACQDVTQFIIDQTKSVKVNLDGKNLDNFMLECGIEFHRAILEHFLNYTFSLAGAITAICDINEYRAAAKDCFDNIPLVINLFDSLKALINLLVVPAQNIKQICSGDDLVNMERSLILSFVQLRADYKSAKLNNLFR